MPLIQAVLIIFIICAHATTLVQASTWKQNNFIITFWSPPPSTKEALSTAAKEGFNLTWTDEHGLEIVRSQGMTAMLKNNLLNPITLNSPEQRAKLDALISRVQNNPALEAYYIVDEPKASDFPALGRLVAYIRERDPNHFAYINLFPVYASNEQLGTKGTPEIAYREYLRRYIDEVKPALISYDHYHFFKSGDGSQYFLNLELIRQAAQENGLPFLNIIQTSTILKTWRLVNAAELRWLVYTTLAYGGRGISYFLYWGPTAYGGLYQDGIKTPLIDSVTILNKELSAQSSVLMDLDNLGTYHTNPLPIGTKSIPISSPVQLGGTGNFVLGLFGKNNNISTFMIVNRNYKNQSIAQIYLKPDIRGLEEFDRSTKKWKSYQVLDPKHSMSVTLNPGDGKLYRFVR